MATNDGHADNNIFFGTDDQDFHPTAGITWNPKTGQWQEDQTGGGHGGIPLTIAGSWWQKLLGYGKSAGGSGLLKALPAILSFFGGKKAGKPSAQERQLMDLYLQQMKTLMPLGADMLQKGKGAADQSLNYMRGVASNPREAMTPELNQEARSDRAAMSSVGEMGMRGGASADVLSRLPFMRIGATTNRMFAARNDANKQLFNAGQGYMGTGLSAFTGGRAAGGGMLDLNQNQFERGQQTGNGIYQIAKGLIDAYTKKNGSNDNSGTGLYGT